MDTTNQVSSLGRSKYDKPRNPKGVGGFQDRPEDRSPGGWKKENVVSYQFKRFMNMSDDEFRAFAKTPTSEMTVAMRLAYNRVKAADKSLPDFKEVVDRTEGKAVQPIEANVHTTIDDLSAALD